MRVVLFPQTIPPKQNDNCAHSGEKSAPSSALDFLCHYGRIYVLKAVHLNYLAGTREIPFRANSERALSNAQTQNTHSRPRVRRSCFFNLICVALISKKLKIFSKGQPIHEREINHSCVQTHVRPEILRSTSPD